MAIAFDNATDASGTLTLTFSHTTSGANRILLVGLYNNGSGADVVTSVTYNGVAMTQLSKQSIVSGVFTYLYGLINPASGANNVSISGSTSDSFIARAISYTGCNQSTLPDASNYLTASGSPATHSVTTVTDNDWVVLFAANADTAWTAGSGATARSSISQIEFFDSNGAVTPPASYSMTLTYGGAQRTYGWFQIAIAPPGAGGGHKFLTLLGVS